VRFGLIEEPKRAGVVFTLYYQLKIGCREQAGSSFCHRRQD
jgi:hypothetical protein